MIQRTPNSRAPIAALAFGFGLAGLPSGIPAAPSSDVQVHYSEERERCLSRHPERRALFGDLHVHTAYSYDAYGNGTRTGPQEAYAFARGEAIDFPPYDAAGKPAQRVRIDRRLDFMALTDHAETLGDVLECSDPSRPGYASEACRTLRTPGPEAFLQMAEAISTALAPAHLPEICGDDDSRCVQGARERWAAIQAATEAAYDRSEACKFTSFHGYEYTGTPDTSNLHRNVIFRNAKVPSSVVSYVEAPEPYMLWQQLDAACVRGVEGCDVLAIPHNSNLSNGRMFPVIALESAAAEQARAALRQRNEPLVEIFQHKAASECSSDRLAGVLGEPDELCDFEQVRRVGTRYSVQAGSQSIEGVVDDCRGGTGTGGMANTGCVAASDFVRGALLLGLQEQARLGTNPYRLGIIASTDTHLSNPGDVKEATWRGHVGYETTLPGRLAEGFMPTNRKGNAGGLAGVWAVENSRDAIFDALERRETFGTSGPRIRPRFFAGWDYPSNACVKGGGVALGYAGGVPMGGTLSVAADRKEGPRWIASALRDPAVNAAPLERLQVIKGWIDAQGRAHNRVFEVAGKPGERHDSLCAVFRDPAFDPGQRAYYYLRALEIPTPRWDALQCQAAGDEAPAACAGERRMIQERAWSSPIWLEPAS